jgi:hypothetical protein
VRLPTLLPFLKLSECGRTNFLVLTGFFTGISGFTNKALSFLGNSALLWSAFAFVLALTPVISDSFFDSPPDPVSCTSSVAEWTKDIPTPAAAEEDIFYCFDFQDMTGSDLLELKDSVSECSSSMDSAYQSQTGTSRRGVRKTEANSQDSRPHLNTQFSNEIYSPSMSSESYNAFTEQTLDMNQIHGPWQASEDSSVYANYSAGQDYAQYATANVAQYTPATISMSSPWVPTHAQFHNDTFNFTYQTPEIMFGPAPSQQQWNSSHFDATDRPTVVRNSSSYTVPQESRRTSAHDVTYGAFVATPTTPTGVSFPQNVEYEQSRLIDSR